MVEKTQLKKRLYKQDINLKDIRRSPATNNSQKVEPATQKNAKVFQS